MIQDMIETLAAAKSAMEENPQLKTTITELTTMLDDTVASHRELTDTHTALTEANTEANARIQALEAELEAARFQELATSSKLDKLVSSFNAAISEVVPSPIPESEPELELVQPVPTVPKSIMQEELNLEIAEAPTDWTDENRSAPQSQMNEGTAKAEDSTPSPELWKGEHHSNKPSGVTWKEWLANGGGRPWWLTDDELSRRSA